MGLFSSAKCRDRIWLIAKFQMRHRHIPGLQRSWHNIICDALPVRVYILRELFAPYYNVSTTSFIWLQPRPIKLFRQFISNTDIEMWTKLYYPAHVGILILAINVIESISRKTKVACTHKLIAVYLAITYF